MKASPEISTDQPVSRQMESHLYDYYGFDPSWNIHHTGTATPLVPQPYHAELELHALSAIDHILKMITYIFAVSKQSPAIMCKQ